jgi:hypothetical protein
MTGPRVRLIVAAVLLAGWLGWLGYAALSKNRGPVVSRAQAAAATNPVVAEVAAGPDGKPATTATVVEPLTGRGPVAGAEVEVANLPDAAGYDGPGAYLLLLVPRRGAESFAVAGQQRSPGYDLAGVGPPKVYRWTDEVRAQARRVFP